ncbi:LuxR family transcriptional regulator [Duganella sp. Leaf61]|nr:LuxR family transcriptional regulator [Duganella sp. Leaf61]
MLSDTSDWREEGGNALLSATTEEDFFAVLSRLARDLGFEYCAFGRKALLPISNPKIYMVNNYSQEWQQRYQQENYVAIDPTVAHAVKSMQPLIWTDALFQASPAFWEDARAHGLKAGCAQSAFDPSGAASLLTLARSNEILSPAEVRKNAADVAWLVQSANQGMANMIARRPAQNQAVILTSREIEVLRWTADGKTSSEVGQIMQISERTVNFHVNNSLEKLGTSNKTACVAKALMLRLL